MLRRIAAVLAGALAATALAAPVAAARPSIDRFPWVFELQGLPCPSGVSYDIHLDVTEIDRDYGDRFVAHYNMDGAAVADNGVAVAIHHVWTETVDFEAGTITVVGISSGSRVIGTSVWNIERGRVVLDLNTFEVLWAAGKSDFEAFDPHLITCGLIDQASA